MLLDPEFQIPVVSVISDNSYFISFFLSVKHAPLNPSPRAIKGEDSFEDWFFFCWATLGGPNPVCDTIGSLTFKVAVLQYRSRRFLICRVAAHCLGRHLTHICEPP